MSETCNECDSEIRVVASSLIQHSGGHYTPNRKKFTARIGLECDCTSESPMATELDSIKFNGEIPDEWGGSDE